MIRIGTWFFLYLCIAAGLFLTGCDSGKGLAGEEHSTGWELEMNAHPNTVPMGTNDTIFVAVLFDGEPKGGITVEFEPTFGDPIPTILTVINDTTIPWGTQPMATYISRDSTGLATIYGTAYQVPDEILAQDSIYVQVTDTL